MLEFVRTCQNIRYLIDNPLPLYRDAPSPLTQTVKHRHHGELLHEKADSEAD